MQTNNSKNRFFSLATGAKVVAWAWKNQSKLFTLATKVFALTTVAMLLIKWGSGRITTEQVIEFIQAINPFTLITG